MMQVPNELPAFPLIRRGGTVALWELSTDDLGVRAVDGAKSHEGDCLSLAGDFSEVAPGRTGFVIELFPVAEAVDGSSARHQLGSVVRFWPRLVGIVQLPEPEFLQIVRQCFAGQVKHCTVAFRFTPSGKAVIEHFSAGC